MADASFVPRLLEVHVTLRAREFREGSNTKIMTGIPIRARIEKTGPPDFNRASVSLRGLRLEDMDKMSTLAFRPMFRGHFSSVFSEAFMSDIRLTVMYFSTDSDKKQALFYIFQEKPYFLLHGSFQ